PRILFGPRVPDRNRQRARCEPDRRRRPLRRSSRQYRRAARGSGHRLRHPHRAAARRRRKESVMGAKLTIAVPSKGRLKDQVSDLFERSDLSLLKTGHERGYRGALKGLDGVEVVYAAAAEIVHQLKSGRVHLGLTGEDLIRE